ncbi:MAG: DUF4140 domain-containing protein, partial [Planctomycetota bacterium]
MSKDVLTPTAIDGESPNSGVSVETEIRRVTVYRSGATVTRVGEFSWNGSGSPPAIRIGGLPNGLADHSVRVRIDAQEGQLEVGDARVQFDVVEGASGETADDEQASQDALRKELAIKSRIARVDAEINALREIEVLRRAKTEKGQQPPPSPTAERLELLSFRSRELARRNEEKRKLEDELRVATEHRKQLAADRLAASTDREPRSDELRKRIVASLRGDSSGDTARVAVEYYVPNAAWAPS